MNKVLSKLKWISVNKELPKKGDIILAYDRMFGFCDVIEVDFEPSKLDPDYTKWILLKKTK